MYSESLRQCDQITGSISALRFHRLEWFHLNPSPRLRQRLIGLDDDRLGHTPPRDGFGVQRRDFTAFGVRRVHRDHI